MAIVEAIQRYYPDWEPPPDYKQWNKTCCPFHGESNPSAAVSYELDGFHCFACDVRGDAVSIIKHEEEVSYAEAFRIAEAISLGCDKPVQRKPARKPRRRVFGEPGDTAGNAVRPGIRERAAAWARDV